MSSPISQQHASDATSSEESRVGPFGSSIFTFKPMENCLHLQVGGQQQPIYISSLIGFISLSFIAPPRLAELEFSNISIRLFSLNLSKCSTKILGSPSNLSRSSTIVGGATFFDCVLFFRCLQGRCLV